MAKTKTEIDVKAMPTMQSFIEAYDTLQSLKEQARKEALSAFQDHLQAAAAVLRDYRKMFGGDGLELPPSVKAFRLSDDKRRARKPKVVSGTVDPLKPGSPIIGAA